MKTTLLGDVCEVNPRTDVGLQATQTCSFIPMEYVDERFGIISHQDTRTVGEVLSGHTFFKDGDVLFAKITPCMENGKAAIARGLVNGIGFGSTEFHVVRPSRAVIPELVFYFLRQNRVRNYAERRMTGSAGQQRVPSVVLEELELHVPPSLERQKRVADILAKADRLRRTRWYSRLISDSFLQSVFLEMFGDISQNPKGWAHERFSKLGTLDRGKSKHRPRNASHLYGGKYPFIQTGDIANCVNYVRYHQQTYSEEGLDQSKLWPPETLCITIAANIAKTGILTYPSCFPDSVVGFLPGENVKTEFVQYWLSFLQANLERTAPESAQKNINLEILRNLDVPKPPFRLQERFAAIVHNFEKLRLQQREAERQSEHLFQTLLHRAFTGGLVGVAKSRSVKRKPSVPAQKRTYSPGVFYRRAAIEAYVINALRGDKYLGRTKLEKIDHLIEYHCGIDLERYPVRDAAGPDDYPSRMKLEHLADKRNWFSAHDKKDGSIVRYLPKRGFVSAALKGAQEIGEKRNAVDNLLELMRPFDTKRCEIIATLYAAWNDFLLARKTPSDAEIVGDVLHNWRPEKQLIPERRWLRGLKWMRDNGLVPRGRGKPVLKTI